MRRLSLFFQDQRVRLFLPYLFLILLPLLLFWKASFGGYLFVLGDFSGSDLLELHLPFKYILHDAYTHGSIPLWTPYLSNGFPILAEGQSGPLYPLNIALAFIPPFLSMNYSIMIALMVAGTGMYTFSRRLPGMNLFGALGSGVVFMLCSFFIARMKHLNMIVVAAYLPWALFCIHKYCTTFKFKWSVLLSFVIALQILAGHPQMLYFCIIMYAWQLVGEVVAIALSERTLLSSSRLLLLSLHCVLGFMLSLMVALGLSAVQLLPTYELTTLSSRQDFTYNIATDYPLHPKYLASLFAPFFLGNPATGSYTGNVHLDGVWWENVLYIGLLPLFLVVALFFFRSKKSLVWYLNRKKGVAFLEKLGLSSVFTQELYWYWFYFISIVVFFLLSLGNYSFLFSVLYYNIPGMTFFRFPTRFNLFTLLSLSIMVGWGLERAVRRLEQSRLLARQKRDISSYYVFSWPFSRKITQLLFLCVLILDLGVFAYQYVAFYPYTSYLYTPRSVKLLQKDPSYFRIYPTTQYSQNPFSTVGWQQRGEKAIASLQEALPGNFATTYHLYSFTDRAWFEGGLGVKDRSSLESLLVKNPLSPDALAKILGLWNVKYLIGFSDLSGTYFTSREHYTLEKSFALPLQIYENLASMPRAYMSSGLYHVASSLDAVESIASEGFDPYQYALTENSVRVASSSSSFNRAAFIGRNSAQILSYSDTAVVMHVTSADGGVLVFSDTYYPGWNAYVDGKMSPTHKINLVQRGLTIEKGEHTIVWNYEPLWFYGGAGISFATLITLGTYLFLSRRKKGSPPSGECLSVDRYIDIPE